MTVEQEPFGKTEEGAEVRLFTCINSKGLGLKLTDFGATVVSLSVPDREGALANVTLGYPSLAGYLVNSPYFGATVGRFAGRIAGARFELDGREYGLPANDGPNHLHGGRRGLTKQLWRAEPLVEEDRVGVRFRRTSPDGEEGYPGRLEVEVVYSLSNEGEFAYEFLAESDKACPINLTNHCYWNLAGAGSGSILDHELMLAADGFLPVDSRLLPRGGVAELRGLPFDFSRPAKIGSRLAETGGSPLGYDHCYVLRGSGADPRLAARVKEARSGRVMDLFTTQPGLVFYSGNFLDGGPSSGGFARHEGFCLETQHFPDSPNRPDFPTTILKPGERYRHKTLHRFSTD